MGFRGKSAGVGQESEGQDVDVAKDGDPQQL